MSAKLEDMPASGAQAALLEDMGSETFVLSSKKHERQGAAISPPQACRLEPHALGKHIRSHDPGAGAAL